MKEPSVTIFLTVKNSSETIKKCVDSLLNLNYSNYSIYVTDAYSTDGTFEILKEYEDKIKLEQVRGNMSKAYNHMTKRTNTDFIAYTDADCVVDSDWLSELVSGFEKEEVIAVAGFCGTPDGLSNFQNAIGKELEQRFKDFPKYIKRAPTMNLAIRTEVAKKVEYDESLDVSQETDWCYKINKYGKILYNPNAKVFHYHRSNIRSYFKQQKKYGKFVVLTYLGRHRKEIKGDNVSPTYMALQIPFFWASVYFILLSLINFSLIYFSLFFVFLIFLIYLFNIFKIKPRLIELPVYFFIFVLRTVAWSIGFVSGLILLIKSK